MMANRNRIRARRQRILAGTSALALLLVASPACAQQSDWTGSASSDWFNPGNWSAGVPTGSTDAYISGVAHYPAQVSARAAHVRALRVGGAAYGLLYIENGGTVSSTYSEIGVHSHGMVTVDGAGSIWNNPDNLVIGEGGNGELTIRNGGTVLNTEYTYIAFNPGSTGTLNIGAALGQAAAAPGVLNAEYVVFRLGNGSIVFNHTGTNYEFIARINSFFPGSGAVEVAAGTTILTAPSSNFSGPTTVSGGRLVVNGSIARSAVTVGPGGTLGGSGTVGATTINGGVLAPGNPVGTLTVNGNLALTTGSTYAVEISPVAANRVNVNGTATLGGAKLAASFHAGSYVAKQYTILNTTGGVSGSFGTEVDTNLPSNFKSGLSYDAKNAYLNLTLNLAAAPGLTPNQSGVADVLNKYFDSNGGIPLAFGSLTPAGLSQAAGELATGAQTISSHAMNQFVGIMADPSSESRGVSLAPGPAGFAAYAYAPDKAAQPPWSMPLTTDPDPDAWRWSVWSSGFGGAQFTDADAAAGTAAITSRVYGGSVGADYRLSPSTIAGFALAGGATSFGNGLGSGRSDLFQAGAFIRHHIGQSYLSAALAYGWQGVTTNRSVTGADDLQARFDVNSWSGRIEGGHRFETPWAALTPYAAVQATTVALPAYAETALTGSSVFALSYAAQDVSMTRSEFGLRSDASFTLAGLPLSLRGGIAWVYNFDTTATAIASFQALPGATFLVNGAALDHNALRTTATAELDLKNGFMVAGTFDGEFAENSHSLGGKAVIRFRW